MTVLNASFAKPSPVDHWGDHSIPSVACEPANVGSIMIAEMRCWTCNIRSMVGVKKNRRGPMPYIMCHIRNAHVAQSSGFTVHRPVGGYKSGGSGGRVIIHSNEVVLYRHDLNLCLLTSAVAQDDTSLKFP